eukprot:gene23868-30972_t
MIWSLMKVCIIGGGVAGISAARILKDNDIDFEIVEASSVLGGRIHQEKFAGFSIDAGAKCIQGLDGNPIWDDFKRFSRTKDKEAVTNSDDVSVFDENGKLVENANYSLDFLSEISDQRKRDGKPDIAALLYNGIDGEFAEGPRVTSLFQTCPLPTRTEFKDGDCCIKRYHIVESVVNFHGGCIVNVKRIPEKFFYTHVICTYRERSPTALRRGGKKIFKSNDDLLIEDIFVPRWHSNPLFCGSFSNWPIDVSREPFNLITVPVNRIHFAGEHTSAKFNGYVQGAYFSGIDAAKEVITSIKSPPDYTHPLADRVKEIQEMRLNSSNK